MDATGRIEKLSVLMPAHNEAGTIREIVRRVLNAPVAPNIELIIVNDGSTDGSRDLIDELARDDERITAIHHERSLGKGTAIRTAIDALTGDAAIVQDGVLYGARSVTKSDDKDLRLTPAPFYESEKGKIDVLPEGDRFGWIDAGYTPSLALRVKGHGTKFFWAQMLMGDTADHVRGLERWEGKLIAEAGTLDVLGPVEDENEAANRILWAYAKIGQDALAEAQVLWLRRSEQDCAYRYRRELDLDKNLRTWLDQLNDYHQAVIKQKLEERDAEASEDPT